MQVYIYSHPDLFYTSAALADLRLFLLCMILGLTGWSGLCRLLRAETLKLRELEYVQAARAFGVSHWHIMRPHLLPMLWIFSLTPGVLNFPGLVPSRSGLPFLATGSTPSCIPSGSLLNACADGTCRLPLWGGT